MLFPLFSIGQVFAFFKPQTIIDTTQLLKADTFQFTINDATILIADEGGIFKIKENKVVDSTSIDFGYMYHIYNVGYFLKGKRIYFMFFIREGGWDYAALYSYKIKNLKGYKRLHFVNCFDLKSSALDGDILKLEFSNKSYNINLKNELQSGDDYSYIVE